MRYFADNDNTVWRFDGIKMQVRTNSGWAKSLFRDPADLSRCINHIREIPKP